MATVQQHIRETFLAKLAEAGIANPDKIAKLRDLMADGKKLKPDDVVTVFTTSKGVSIT